LAEMEDLSFNIEADMQALLNEKDSLESSYQKATLSCFANGNPTLTANIKVRPRGVTRKSLCDFPPIMMKISKDERKEIDLKKTDNIKLVTYCKEKPDYEKLVLREYVMYKLYNVLTDTSYRVKLVKASFIDSKGKLPTTEKHGFMIEPTDEMADRLLCKYDEDDTSPIKKIHKEQYKNFVVFQYMTGNTDWNLSERHNIRMLECDSDKGPKPVPYDFDYSGMVNADYAKPHPILPIKSVTERLFQFRGSEDEDFTSTYKIFNDKKAAFYAVITDFELLDSSIKTEMTSYLDEFYINIASSDIMAEEIKKARRKR